MFDFGFSELLVIGVVLLIVVGPERLPKVARTAGHLIGRVQRYVSDVKSDIQREIQLEELKKLQDQVRQQADALEASVRAGMATAEAGVAQVADEVRTIAPPELASVAPMAVGATDVDAAPQPVVGEDDGVQLRLELDPAATPTPDSTPQARV